MDRSPQQTELRLPARTPSQANTDKQVIDMWLHGKSPHTQSYYERVARQLLEQIDCSLQDTTLRDLQAWADTLEDYAASSRATMISAVKSLFAFAHRIGYLPFDVGAVLTVPSAKDCLAERILPETAVQRMLALEPSTRNRALLETLYRTGMRVSECCGLRWRDVQPRATGAQVTIYGKGGATRVVLFGQTLYKRLQELQAAGAGKDPPIFQSRERGPLSRQQVYYIVRQAADRAGIDKDVSPHWLRHAHASHALDRGAPVHVVQQTLGHADLSTTGRYAHVRPEDSSAHYLAE